MCQLFQERFNRRQVGDVDSDLRGPHRTRFEAGPNRRDICVAGSVGHGEPHRDDHERHQTQLWPGEPQELNHDEHEDRPDAACDAIDRDVDKGLGAKPDLARKWKKEDLSGCPVDGVSNRPVDDAGHRWGPQDAGKQDHNRGHPEADREGEHGEADAQQTIGSA